MLSGSSEEEAYAIQIGQTEGAPSLQLVSQKRSAPLTLPAWMKAWNRFSAILSERDTSVMAGLAHHMENVLNLADKKAGWRYYDEQFRHLIGSGMAVWGSTHLELYMKVHLKCPSTNDRAGNTPWAQQPLAKVPRGACSRYHSSLPSASSNTNATTAWQATQPPAAPSRSWRHTKPCSRF